MKFNKGDIAYVIPPDSFYSTKVKIVEYNSKGIYTVELIEGENQGYRFTIKGTKLELDQFYKDLRLILKDETT